MKKMLVCALAASLSVFLVPDHCMAADKPETGRYLDISGLPFHGPKKAPVTIVVFTDYL